MSFTDFNNRFQQDYIAFCKTKDLQIYEICDLFLNLIAKDLNKFSETFYNATKLVNGTHGLNEKVRNESFTEFIHKYNRSGTNDCKNHQHSENNLYDVLHYINNKLYSISEKQTGIQYSIRNMSKTDTEVITRVRHL